jgi:2-phosphosulfolactate phosphatase
VRVYVENGLAGCTLACGLGGPVVVVDALRASAMVASLFHYGTRSLLVVREVEEAFAQKQRLPEAVLAGERGGPRVPGFDLGNSPLQSPPDRDISCVVFSSSNCSRCCVGVAGLPAAFLASTVNAAAVARRLRQVAPRAETLTIVTAGSIQEEVLLTLEDHVAAGAIMAACGTEGLQPVAGNDRAQVCQRLFGDGDQAAVTAAFQGCSNGRRLASLGLGADVEFASRLNVFAVTPRIVHAVNLPDGALGAVLDLDRPA